MRHDRRRHHESHELDSYGRESRRIAWLEANGFTHRRSFFDLQGGIETPLAPAVWPTGVAIARYRPGEEDEAVHALIYVEAAWAEVPGHTQRSLEAWRSTLMPEYRGWVARRDGRPVGWVAGRVFERRARMGRAARRRPLRTRSRSRPRVAAALARRAPQARCDLARPRRAGRERERHRPVPRRRL